MPRNISEQAAYPISIFNVVNELNGRDERQVIALHGEHDEVHGDHELGLVELIVFVQIGEVPHLRQV